MNPTAYKLILGDAFEEIKKFKDESFDAVVTDPPFGIGYKYIEKEKNATADQYWKWLSPAYDEMNRVLKKGGFLAIWQTQLYFPFFWKWYGDDIHIYTSCKNFVQLRKTEINYAYDPIIMKYKKGGESLSPSVTSRNVDFFVSNTAKFVLEKKSLARKHPCPRPIDQVEEIIKNFTVEHARVLDIFMGSGTTALACLKHDREFTGIEIIEKYYHIAQKRIENFLVSQKKRDLFKWISS